MSERICLIVDDEPAVRSFLRLVLAKRGIWSLEAGNAAEALRIVQKLGGEIDLMITDVQMPGEIDGIDLACSVKSSFPTLPVIVVSGYGDGAPAGITFLQKPFTPNAILKAVEAAERGAGVARTPGAGERP